MNIYRIVSIGIATISLVGHTAHASGHLQLGTKYTGKTYRATLQNIGLGSVVAVGKEKKTGIIAGLTSPGYTILFFVAPSKKENDNFHQDYCSTIGETFMCGVPLENIHTIGCKVNDDISGKHLLLSSKTNFTAGQLVYLTQEKKVGILQVANNDDGSYQVQTNLEQEPTIIICEEEDLPSFQIIRCKRKPRLEMSPVIDPSDDYKYLENPSVKRKRKHRFTLAPTPKDLSN